MIYNLEHIIYAYDISIKIMQSKQKEIDWSITFEGLQAIKVLEFDK